MNNSIILYEIKTGSKLYGLETSQSDNDYIGVFIENKFEDYINPFKHTKEIDTSIKSKKESGKNDINAIDRKYYHLNDFLKLCIANNPNIIEMLFAPQKDIITINPIFKSLIIDNPQYFINKQLINKFLGYVKSQENKSYIISDNYVKLNTFKCDIETFIQHQGINSNKVSLLEFTKEYLVDHWNIKHDAIIKYGNYIIPKKIKHSNSNIEIVYQIGNMTFSPNLMLKDILDQINNKLKRASHRVGDILVHKYEPKCMHHMIRLLIEAYQLICTGKIEFPFKDETKKLLMNIKLGKIDIKDIPSIVNYYKNLVKMSENNNNLPNTANYEEINKIYSKVITSIYKLTKGE